MRPMRVFAYCCSSSLPAVRRAAGVQPMSCPPVNVDLFALPWLDNRDLVYFDLHGIPGGSVWYGDFWTPALTEMQVRAARLNGAVVFATNCFLADESSPMLDALLSAGARYVIAGEGPNWTGQRGLVGAALLGLWVRRLLSWRVEPVRALALAKARVRLVKGGAAAHDTLGFKAFYRKHDGG